MLVSQDLVMYMLHTIVKVSGNDLLWKFYFVATFEFDRTGIRKKSAEAGHFPHNVIYMYKMTKFLL